MLIGVVRRIWAGIDARLRVPEAGRGPWGRRGLRGARLAVLVGRRFRSDLCSERAASLAFSSVVAAIPAAMIVLLSIQLLYGAELLPGGPGGPATSESAGTGAVEETTGADAADGGERVTAAETMLGPVFDKVSEYVAEENREEVRRALGRLERELEIDRRLRSLIAQSENQRGAVTGIAIFVLVMSAMTLFRSAERAFTGIWRVERRRGAFEKVATFWLLLTAAPLILAISVYMKSKLGSTIDGRLGEGSALAEFVRTAILDFAFPLSISFFAFMLLLAYLPHTRVRLSAAAAGALVTAIGWELGTRAFQLYVQNTLLSGVLGALGVIPFFLLWVYFSWAIVLVGAETAYCLQHFPVLVSEVWGRVRERTVPRPTLALLILERVYRAFGGDGSAPNADLMATRLSVPIAEVEEVAAVLLAADLLLAQEGGWSPARASDRLRPSEVVSLFPTRAGFRLPAALDGIRSPLADLLQEVDGTLTDRLGQVSFADLIVDPHPACPAETPPESP